MKIRKDVLAELQKTALDSSIEKIKQRLKQRFQDKVFHYSNEQLDSLCRIGVSKAEGYEIRIEYNVYVFIAAMVVFGQDFDVSPDCDWASDVLSDVNIDETIRSKALELQISLAAGCSP